MVCPLPNVGADRSGCRGAFGDNASVVKLNVDDNPSTAQRYGIKGMPTLILFREGKEVERVVGATSKESITRMIEKYVTVKA